MNIALTQHWKSHLELLDVAFQPIINIHTGKIYGVEALLRNFQDVGFKSIFSLFLLAISLMRNGINCIMPKANERETDAGTKRLS